MGLTIDQRILLLAIIIGLGVSFKKKTPTYLKLLPFFLILLFSVECFGRVLSEKKQNNTLLFNFFSVLEFGFFIYFFKAILPGERSQKIINVLLFGLPTLCLLNIFLLQGPMVFHTHTYSIGSLILVGCGIAYFYQVFKSPAKLNLVWEPAFWISTAVIFFFTASVSILGIINYVSVLPGRIIKNSLNVLHFINALFYILFIIAFLCKLNIQKYLRGSSQIF